MVLSRPPTPHSFPYPTPTKPLHVMVWMLYIFILQLHLLSRTNVFSCFSLTLLCLLSLCFPPPAHLPLLFLSSLFPSSSSPLHLPAHPSLLFVTLSFPQPSFLTHLSTHPVSFPTSSFLHPSHLSHLPSPTLPPLPSSLNSHLFLPPHLPSLLLPTRCHFSLVTLYSDLEASWREILVIRVGAF